MEQAVTKRYLSWEEIQSLVDFLIREHLNQQYDAMLVITRGGMVPGCLISEKIDLRNILVAAVVYYTGVDRTLEKPIFLQFPSDTLLDNKRILVVDDVWDSGKTIVAVRERLNVVNCSYKVAVLHYKPGRSQFRDDRPDYYAETTEDWLVYPWDRERF
jgi:hypoxanthine phosphoribosyltransferase